VEVAKALGGSFKLVTLVPTKNCKGDDSTRGVFLANNLASNDNLTRTTKRQKTYNVYEQYIKRGPNKQQHNKNMLRYKKETRPGLVALYDIRPGNGAGPFFQPQSPHGALELGYTYLTIMINSKTMYTINTLPR